MSAAQQQALAALQARRVVYFEYDSSEIRAEYLEVVAAHAAYLAKYPNARVRLEGHTDERGSREYNIGLGERRAQTVRSALMLQGVADSQIATVSYGEERPAVEGSGEQAVRAEPPRRNRVGAVTDAHAASRSWSLRARRCLRGSLAHAAASNKELEAARRRG